MKSLLIALLFIPSLATAGPYFRIIDTNHPHTSAGAYIAVDDPAHSSVGTSLALITHSPRDGSIIPSMPIDWTPLAVGFGGNSGKFIFGIGPSANLAPIVRDLLHRAIQTASPEPDKYAGLKTLLAPAASQADLSVSFGPAWVLSPLENWKGFFRLQCGVAWTF